MATKPILGLFEGIGIELEYMIVDAQTLGVKPCADQLLHLVGGGYDDEVDRGAVLWSNELALHVIEMKSNGPTQSLSGLVPAFAEQVRDILDLLAPMGAALLPTGMHPWMVPERELRLWPHDNAEIYAAFDRIFGCRGHGFANLQSMHINLPFADDDEFGRLHAAIRLVLPLIPGLTASSPLVEGRLTGTLDNRLEAYRTNCSRIPSVTGLVVPEAVFSRESYEAEILQAIYRDLSALDPEGVLAHEWVNARGAIARFDRMAIEIRTADTQECPCADLAIAELVVAAVRSLVEQRHSDTRTQQRVTTELLARFHQASVERAGAATWPTREYLALFGIDRDRLSVRETWAWLADELLPRDASTKARDLALGVVLEEGTLAERIAGALDRAAEPERQRGVYHRLAQCLAEGVSFHAHER